MTRPPHDLVVLAADKDIEMALRGILMPSAARRWKSVPWT